jgi:hypothetical protein
MADDVANRSRSLYFKNYPDDGLYIIVPRKLHIFTIMPFYQFSFMIFGVPNMNIMRVMSGTNNNLKNKYGKTNINKTPLNNTNKANAETVQSERQILLNR